MAPARCTVALTLLVLSAVGCAATAEPSKLYKRGVDAYGRDEMTPAAEALEAFVEKACTVGAPDPRCREAYIKLGHAHERLGAPGGAWAAYDAALALPPHTRDAAVQVDLDRTKRELTERNGRASDRSPVIVRYRDEVSEEYNPRSVVISLDFDAVMTKEKDANELHSADFRNVFGGSVAAGEHVLLVETVHDCKPGGDAPCARSKVRRAWPFRCAARTPTTIEIRAYAEAGSGTSPARPALELTTH